MLFILICRLKTMCSLMGLFVAILACGQASAQTVSTPSPITHGTPARPPLPHLYWHLLMYQNHLDEAAAAHEKQGKDGFWLRNTLQQGLGFTDAEFAPVRESARRLEKAIAAIDAKAKAIVQADRAPYGKGRLPAGVQPPGWEKLKELNLERETAITDEIAKLNDDLGPADAEKFKEFVEGSFSSNPTAGPHHPQLHLPHKVDPQPAQQQEAQP